MPNTEVKLTEDEKLNWHEFCQSNSMTEAKMLRMMIHKVSPEASSTENIKECRTNKITIRLSDDNHKKLTYRAKAEGYLSQTCWATSAVMANLVREPILTTEEMAVLRDSTRQLAAIGRNLNQIVRVLNIEFRQSDKITKEMIEPLKQYIDKHTAKVYDLLTKNRSRWSINDD